MDDSGQLEEILDGTTLNWHKKYKQAEIDGKQKGHRGFGSLEDE